MPTKKKTKSSGRCWPGFEPVPGKKPGTKGSCRRRRSATKKKKSAR